MLQESLLFGAVADVAMEAEEEHPFAAVEHAQGAQGVVASPGEAFGQSIAAVADTSRHVSRSIEFLALILLAGSVTDLGLVYIVVLLCMLMVAVLLLWVFQLRARLALSQRREQQAQKELQKNIGDLANYRTFEVHLADAEINISKVKADLQDSREQLSRTEHELGEARGLLMQKSNELTETASTLQDTSKELDEVKSVLPSMEVKLADARNTAREIAKSKRLALEQTDSTLMFLNAEKESELFEARKELNRMKQELTEAFDASGAKRRRSV